jgi:predicted CxxxxCH...CXXCH cytochrome family protein
MVLLAFFSSGGTAGAAHNSESDLGSICGDCHNLNPMLADNNTSFIHVSARTLPQMRSANGGVSPGNYSPTGKKFGCTFCHNDALRTIQGKAMKDSFNPFLSKPSQHPVDRSFSKDANGNLTLGANTGTNLYMSNWDNSWVVPTDQIDCIDCHDASANGGSYPNHPASGTGSRVAAVNPFMLRNTAAMDNSHAPNSFCLTTCHGRSASSPATYKMGHLGWGAFDNTTGGMADNTLKEPSGIALKTSKCADCHETHSTNSRPNLMGELRQSIRDVDPANCTSVCHADTSFVSRGHGRTTGTSPPNLLCTNCHNTSVSHRDSINPRRLGSNEASPPNNLLAVDLRGDGLDSNFNGVVDDAAEGTTTLGGESLCGTCHANKHVHGGSIAGNATASSGKSVGCLYCHEPHSSGTDNNVRMVRRRLNGATVNYLTDKADYYRGDNTGVCSNINCHGVPMSTIMTTVSDHQPLPGGGVGVDCSSCHSHSAAGGALSGSFAPVCNSCHTMPGETVLAGTHVLSPVHDKHALPDAGGGYGFGCSTCHYKYTHNQSGVVVGGSWTVPNGNVNIKFDGTWNPKNANGPLYASNAADNTLADNTYAPGVGGTGVCAGLYCHGNSAAVASWPAGSDPTPVWNTASTGACGTCHKVLANDPPATYAHAKHADNTVTGYAISCRKCHYQTTNDGLTITSRSAHLNRQSNVTFDTTDAQLSSGSYSGTATVGDSGTTTGTCSNIFCHSPGTRMTAPFDNGALGVPDWKQGALACNACHGATGQAGISLGMPAYANGSPKVNTHAKHLSDKFACQVCHWSTTTTGNTITGRSNHVNGVYNAVNDNLARHAFTYSAPNCSASACHGGHTSGPNWPAWGGGAYGCEACHAYAGGVATTADVDQFAWDNGIARINADQWNGSVNGSGHGKTLAYASGNPGAGLRFATCTSNCHVTSVSHDNAVNPFRLRTYFGIADFSDTNRDPGAQQDDNLICLDCHSASGANPAKATRIIEQNHYGATKHTASTMGGTFCVDCHDPHGDANHYMIHDNVTQVSDGVYGKPAAVRPTTFSKTNLDGAGGLDTVYDWGDYVKSTSPYTGICQTCHASSGGALYFNTSGSGYLGTHNKTGSPPGRCTTCHDHDTDFSPSCNSCHGEVSGPGAGGAPPYGPFSSHPWASRATVDNISLPAGLGDHRAVTAAGITRSSHETFGCNECHTTAPGSDAAHDTGKTNASMSQVAALHGWTGAPAPAAASWTAGTLAGGVSGGSVTDDSCSNINCHSPHYSANSYLSGTPNPYTRYWLNQTRWDCYACHSYDGRTATSRPGGTDNTMSTGAHSTHVGSMQYACSRCHDVTGYSATTWPNTNAAHKDGFVNWSFAGSPNPNGTTPAYSVATGSAAPTDDNTTAGHRSWGSCSSLYCHSIGQKATGAALTGAAGEYKTPSWDNALSGKCGTCHGGDGLTENPGNWIASASHTQHVNTATYSFGCATCHNGLGRGSTTHADNGINLSFGSVGSVSLASTVYSQGLAHVAGNGFGNCTVNYCHGTGATALTGGANQATTNRNLPLWGTATTGNCGSCHGAPGATTNYPTASPVSNWPTSGSHARHMSDVIGPRIASCGDCHSSATDNTHANGTVNLRTSRLDNTATTLTLTATCDPCHGSGVATAKANWLTVASVDCLTCHGSTAAYTYANATGRVAPNVGGDNTTYGSNVRGHNRAGGAGNPYPVTGNPAASRTCEDCHDASIAHVDGTDNTTFAGNRLLATVNGNATGSTVAGLCAACHTTAGASPATKKSINSHGNAGYADRLEASFTALSCNQCHEPHGMVNVSTGTTGVNLWMINPTITVTTGVTVSQVRLFAKSGANSFNAYDPGPTNELNAAMYATNANDQLCAVCHASASNPGQPMAYNISGRHNAPGYTGNEAGKDCSGCHSHNQDAATGTVDGLMPLACNGCHSYPGLDNTGTNLKQMSAGHRKHVGQPLPTGNGTNNKGYECTLCHFNYTHNQSNLAKGELWTGPVYDNVNINFDPSWNPGSPTYNSQAVPTTGNGGTGACAGLKCHGGNATENAGWGGSATSPTWSGTVACGACHATSFATKNHPAHLTAVNGPGAAAFTAGGTCSEGSGCHTRYDLTPNSLGGLHANNVKNLRSTSSDNGYVGATLATTQVCRNCHSTYVSVPNIPTSGDALVRTQANWDNSSYLVACITCHNGGSGTQAYANLNGTGGRAAAIEGTYYAKGHGDPTIDVAGFAAPPLRCSWCHADTDGHIGANRPTGSNPWRLSNISSYSLRGRVDEYCSTSVCHSAGADHWWRVDPDTGVSADATKAATDTHPTTTPAVPSSPIDKSRWFQIPLDVNIPLQGNLTDNAYNKSVGLSNHIVCVSCHDPHGVGASAISTRSFSGANDNGYKMLRYKSAGGVMSPLCSKCHK